MTATEMLNQLVSMFPIGDSAAIRAAAMSAAITPYSTAVAPDRHRAKRRRPAVI